MQNFRIVITFVLLFANACSSSDQKNLQQDIGVLPDTNVAVDQEIDQKIDQSFDLAPDMVAIDPLVVTASTKTPGGAAVYAVSTSVVASGGVAPYRYSWDFDDSDGLQTDKHLVDATFVYAKAGTYTATITVTDSRGQSAKDTLQFVISAPTWSPTTKKEVYDAPTCLNRSTPLIIENKEFANFSGKVISTNLCSDVIIRNNYIHGTKLDPNETDPMQGYAIYIQSGSNVEIYNNYIDGNLRGILVTAPPGNPSVSKVTIRDNWVSNTVREATVYTHAANLVTISNNVLLNNGDWNLIKNPGDPEDGRTSGIHAMNFDTVNIFDNFVVNCSSDGISVSTTLQKLLADKNYFSKNFFIYNNTTRENGEQGIWMLQVDTGQIHHNYIDGNYHVRQDMGSRGVFAEGGAKNVDIYQNWFYNNESAGVNLNHSHDNNIFQNVFVEPRAKSGAVHFSEHYGIETNPRPGTYNNSFKNNVVKGSSMGGRIEACDGCKLVNNTVHANGPSERGTGGFEVEQDAKNTIIKNNIISKNTGAGIFCNNGTAQISYNNVWQNRLQGQSTDTNYQGCSAGTGDISVDPLFLEPDNYDFRLQESSQCKTAGDPNLSSDKEIGAYGNLGN